MRPATSSSIRRPLLVSLFVLPAIALLWRPVGAGSATLRSLIVGGGPKPEYNQVSIERHVAYFTRQLPAGTPRYTLFANGDTKAKTVAFDEEPKTLPPGEQAFALLFEKREDAWPTIQRFRAPQLGRLDGPAKRAAVATGFEWLKKDDPERVLLYFAGHGSRGRLGDLDNSSYDLWGEQLSVRDLAEHVEALPSRTAVTLVMVQCYAGAFANLIFNDGDPKGQPVDREIVGFFAAPRERMASGCTTEVNEANYQDFSSYFFAALTGRDRVGRPVRGADYDDDGRVGMNEAFAYCLVNDASIDVPICTSDVFLRWAMTTPNEEVFQTPFSQVRSWATPSQVAALDALSRDLKLTSESRPADAYHKMLQGGSREVRRAIGDARRRYMEVRDELRAPLLARWPDLARPGESGYATARTEATAALGRRVDEERFKALFAAEAAISKAEERQYEEEIEEARVLRFVRLVKSIVLAHRLQESGDPAIRKRLERLLRAEAGTFRSVSNPVARSQ